MPEFPLDLGDEQRELRDWVHGFAAATVRPAAAGWDEREETPWPMGTSLAVAAAAFCSTEPGAGSDVAAIRTRTRYDEATDQWVLTGQKSYARRFAPAVVGGHELP